MVSNESLANQLTDSPASLGTFLKSGSPNVAEALGQSELEFLVIDRQHAAMNVETIENVLRAADVTGKPTIVRIPEGRLDLVNTVLDAGANGLMIPQVETVERISRVNERARYSGDRSLSLGTRAGDFGYADRSEYETSVQRLTILPQIETQGGTDVVEEIVDLEFVNSVMIGPGDLSRSLGLASKDNRLYERIDEIIEMVHAAGCGAGIWVSSKQDLNRYRNRVEYVVYRTDLSILTGQVDVLKD